MKLNMAAAVSAVKLFLAGAGAVWVTGGGGFPAASECDDIAKGGAVALLVWVYNWASSSDTRYGVNSGPAAAAE